MNTFGDRVISRREWLGMSLGAGATLTLSPALLGALQKSGASGGNLIERAIPSTGEKLPVISFSPQEESDIPGLKEILKTLTDNGGRVVDVLHGGAEYFARKAAAELGIQDKLFWTTNLPTRRRPLPGHNAAEQLGPDAARAAIEEKLATFNVPKVDLLMVGTNDLPTHLPMAKQMKKEGLVRYIGVHDLTPPPYQEVVAKVYPELESIMRNEPIDFVATDYIVSWRGVEEKILPLAQERKIGFMAYFTLDRARLLSRVSGVPLPEWAVEFDAKTWPQFCLKYVVSHPAVIVARTGTTKAAHMLDNLGGGIGRLPDQGMRKRMAEFVDALPPVSDVPPKPKPPQVHQAPAVALSAAILDRYVGEYLYAPTGQTMTVRRDGDRLLIKSGAAPEGPLVARSETRFGAPWQWAIIEFQLDGQGKVTGAVVERPSDRIPLERK